jgi:hypothetical protein
MRAIAKWFLGRCAAATKRHSFFDRKPVSVGIDQFHFTCHNVGAVLYCFDFYVSHDETLKHQFRGAHASRVLANARLALAHFSKIVFGPDAETNTPEACAPQKVACVARS